jgi:hypothetical protein
VTVNSNGSDDSDPFYTRSVVAVGEQGTFTAEFSLTGIDPGTDATVRVYTADTGDLLGEWTAVVSVPWATVQSDGSVVGTDGQALDSMLAGGCIVSGANVYHSLLFSNVWVDEYSQLEHTLVLPGARIGCNCRLTNTLIDARCNIAVGTVIGEDPEEDAQQCEVSRDGVTLVTRHALGQRKRPGDKRPGGHTGRSHQE